MATVTKIDRTPPYLTLLKKQDIILQELRQLNAKMNFFGSLTRFEDLAKKGRVFAKKRSIRPIDVLSDD